ncbi:probable trehalose-phosphate phosphatase 4 isoform X1 [Andrographis paniculata]|uniref:probable trehalose-phosphate phosphatase 4 isoform X1 n=1 Tax=Andrographis paniculata TaxID=175694 RepID=UPI0021E8EC3A|nr:probable trehalose-phosphate phosphatase 4 isoform X1 [Andrographis paniculata]
MISDGNSGRTMAALAVVISEPAALFSPKPQIPHFPVAGMKLLRRLERHGNKARINPLLDSMRSSSPSRRPPDAAAGDHTSWMLNHPSALSMFGEIAAAAAGKQMVVFLDYDGTLSPIVKDPDCAFMPDETRKAVRDVAKYFPTAIVTGRCRAKVYEFVRLPELYYAGSHGMDIKGPSKGHQRKVTTHTSHTHPHVCLCVSFWAQFPHICCLFITIQANQTVLCQPAKEFLPIIDEVYKILMEKMKRIPGAKVENNKFCLSVHYRCVEEKRWGEVAEEVKDVIKEYQRLRLNQGRKVLEIRPTIKWDKGNAIEFLLHSLGYANSKEVVPIYVGDDRTDEDAFKVLKERGQGLGILVSKCPKETNASYTLKDPSEVMQFLNHLVDWKRRKN